MSAQELYGIVAGILVIPAIGMYAYSILKLKTKPDRVTWWILTFISSAVALSYQGVGARETIWLPFAYVVGYLLIALLSLRFGHGPFTLSTLDRVSLVGGVASVFAYSFAQSALLALLLSTLTECIALVPTAVKSYTNPETEDRLAWIIATIASIFNLLAVGEWSLAIAGYPIWVLASNSIITYLIIRKRKFAPAS